MAETSLLHLLVFCGVLSQGIIVTSLTDDIQESSTLVAREKRVVNLEPGGNQIVRIDDVKYMTNIKEYNQSKCVGVILSDYTVITAAQCIQFHISHYELQSGSAYKQYTINHTVTSAVKFFGSLPRDHNDGIALLTVDPPFQFSSKTGAIELYSGPLASGTLATVSGWGCIYPLSQHTGIHRRLRKITLPIMNHGECQNIYRDHFRVSNKHICTYDRQKFCAHTDLGAPLVVNHMLAGIHVFKGEYNQHINPDVFIDLQLPEYKEWVERNILSM